MKGNKIHKRIYPDNVLVISCNNKNLPKERKVQPVNKSLLASASDVLEGEIVHKAKIEKLLKELPYEISQAYTITEEHSFKRVSIIRIDLGEIVTIYRTETLIEGLCYIQYVPETIKDLKLINNHEPTKNKSASEG